MQKLFCPLQTELTDGYQSGTGSMDSGSMDSGFMDSGSEESGSMEDRKRVFKICQLRQLASYSYIIVDHCVCSVCQKEPFFEFLKQFKKIQHQRNKFEELRFQGV